MSYGKSSLLRKLIPKSYHFDGYNETKCPNTRDKPFFAEGVAKLGEYYLNKRIDNSGNLILEYSSVCPNGLISFKPYILSFESFIELLRTAIDEESDFITFQIQTTYKPCSDTRCLDKNTHCSHLLKDKPHTLMAAVSFEVTDIKNALSVYFGINKPKSFKGGNTTMKDNNIFGINFNDFGLCTDPNISATLMGVAVRNPADNDWYIFNPTTQTLTSTGGMNLGCFDVYILPTTDIKVGDLLKLDGKYSHVQSFDNKYVELLGVADGIVQKKLISESFIPGMKLYPKVVAFDPTTLSNLSSKENMGSSIMAAMLLMEWTKKDKTTSFSLDEVNNNSYNGLGKFLPILLATKGANGFGNILTGPDGKPDIATLMMLGSVGNDSNDTMKALVLSSLFSGGNNSMFGGAIPGITTTAVASGVTNASEVYCPECKETYPAGTNFCSHCGTQTVSVVSNAGEVFCPVCNVSYSAGTNFCPKCGTATQVKGKVCAKCGATLNDGAAFCHNCGQKVVNDSCPKCGEKVTEGAKFCSSCGTSLTPVTPKKTNTLKPAPKKNTTPRKKAAPKPKETAKPESDM